MADRSNQAKNPQAKQTHRNIPSGIFRYIEDTPKGRILEYLYRAKMLRSDHVATAVELAWFNLNPANFPTNTTLFPGQFEAARSKIITFPTELDKAAYINALESLVEAGLIEKNLLGYRLSPLAYDVVHSKVNKAEEFPISDEIKIERSQVVTLLFGSVPVNSPDYSIEHGFEVKKPKPDGKSDGCSTVAIIFLVLILVLAAVFFLNNDSDGDQPAPQPPAESKPVEIPPDAPVNQPESQEIEPVTQLSTTWIPLDLRTARDGVNPVGEVLTLGGLFQPPIEELMPGGFEYGLGSESAYLESESDTSQRSSRLAIAVGRSGVTGVHLLLNLRHTRPVDTLPEGIDYRLVGQVTLQFEGAVPLQIDLVARDNIRDWLISQDGVVNQREGENAQFEVIRGKSILGGWDARIDRFIMDIPVEYRGMVLESIIIDDFSWRELGTPNPGIVWFGGALEVGK